MYSVGVQYSITLNNISFHYYYNDKQISSMIELLNYSLAWQERVGTLLFVQNSGGYRWKHIAWSAESKKRWKMPSRSPWRTANQQPRVCARRAVRRCSVSAKGRSTKLHLAEFPYYHNVNLHTSSYPWAKTGGVALWFEKKWNADIDWPSLRMSVPR